VRVFEVSAKDGSSINVVQREVILIPGVRPPSTGDGGLSETRAADQHHELVGLAAGAAVVLLGVVLMRWRTG
jgi:hypothetical protein